MASRYYVAVRPQTDENHAIHKEGCPFLPDGDKRIYIGEFSSGHDALNEGHRYFIKTNKCIFCSGESRECDGMPPQKTIDKKGPLVAGLNIPGLQGLMCCLN